MSIVKGATIREVLWQEDFSDDVYVQLSDYIGNKLQYDQNVRDNVREGLLPKEEGIKRVNNLTEEEFISCLEKVREIEEINERNIKSAIIWGGENCNM